MSTRTYRLALAAFLPLILLLGAAPSNGRAAGMEAVAGGSELENPRDTGEHGPVRDEPNY